MEVMTDEVEISDSLPAAYHFGVWILKPVKMLCLVAISFSVIVCHVTRWATLSADIPEPLSSGKSTIERMHRYVGSNFDEELLRSARKSCQGL